jgi:N-formylglutamate deformylase
LHSAGRLPGLSGIPFASGMGTMNTHPETHVFDLHDENLPIVAAAVHDGHYMRPEVLARTKLSEEERLREEDPFTSNFAQACQSRLIGLRSRFEVDLNRPREQAIYQSPEDAWGLDVWNAELPLELVERSLAEYDDFYDALDHLLRRLVSVHRQVVVLDLHTYNHRRQGPDGPLASPDANPEVNIGTGSVDRDHWGELIDRFEADLEHFDDHGRHLDVRENVKFQGGNMSKWIHSHFAGSVCSISIEFKKFFMNEWTGQADWREIEALTAALRSTLPGLRDSQAHLAEALSK